MPIPTLSIINVYRTKSINTIAMLNAQSLTTQLNYTIIAPKLISINSTAIKLLNNRKLLHPSI